MEEFYEDFLRLWKRIRDRTKDSDAIVEQLRKEIEFRNLAPYEKIIGISVDRTKKKR